MNTTTPDPLSPVSLTIPLIIDTEVFYVPGEGDFLAVFYKLDASFAFVSSAFEFSLN